MSLLRTVTSEVAVAPESQATEGVSTLSELVIQRKQRPVKETL